MLELSPSDPIINTYLKDIQHLKSQQQVAHELGLKGPFQTLLDKAAKKRGWTLVPELSTHSGGKRVVPDGTVRDEFRLARGWWEAKDTSDNLAAEIQKKLKAGYPTRNTIFEDTQTAVLFQDVFGIQVGVGITLAVKKKGATPRLRYHRVPEMWHKGEKLEFLENGIVPWQMLTPDTQGTWLVPEHADEYREFLSVRDIFDLRSLGVSTNRNAVAYDWDRDKLASRIQKFIHEYNAEVHRHKADPGADWPDRINWSRDLKQDCLRGHLANFDQAKICPALYRPFTKRWLFFDRIVNEEIYQWPKIFGAVIVLSDIGSRAPAFSALMTDRVADLHLCAAINAHQCFPLSHLKDSAVEQFRARYADRSITREDVFHYLYALLHHPAYRERFAANLKRELARIPFAPDFRGLAEAGRELARLHVDYESLQVWPLKAVENEGLPYSERVTKMKLSENKDSIRINESLTLTGIPPETFEYRLGSRSALEWVIDQYQVKGDSDPNREDDPHYIVLLVGQVVRVSIETARIVKSLPQAF